MTAPLSLGGISLLTQTPILHQLFALGPGFSPVPAKLVNQIMAKEFVELNELLNAPKPQLRFDGWLVLTSTPKKLKWQVDDITSWLEAFQCIALFLSSHFLHRWKDLLHYPLHYPLSSRLTGCSLAGFG